ncbi:hypothetical protein I4U23_027136 [Adineta vaga]|nr:hypothetical protein I4U23_027136 [Adineta vaga]
MGGIGTRFSKENYRFPKPLINIIGRPMLFWLLDNLETEDNDIIYLGLLENLDKQFNLSQRLQIEYPNKKFEKILLDFETRGAVETLFIVLQSMNSDRLQCKTISLDCDTIYFQSILKQFHNTLVTYPTIYGDYNSVEPIQENIQLVKELYQAGHYIIIQTARRMKTHQGNIGAVIADIGHITLNTLQKFQIPYHELFFGKPYADIYIDDSAIHALIDTTKEIGWLINDQESNLNKKTKQIKGFISSRHFHTIEQLDHLIIKSSTTSDLEGEIYFYKNIPLEVEDLFPKFDRIEINEEAGISSLVIEKISGITYSHLFTNLCLTQGRLLKLLPQIQMSKNLPTIYPQLQPVVVQPYTSNVHTTVVVGGRSKDVQHCCHCLLCVLTSGLWAPCWLGACCGCCCERPC